MTCLPAPKSLTCDPLPATDELSSAPRASCPVDDDVGMEKSGAARLPSSRTPGRTEEAAAAVPGLRSQLSRPEAASPYDSGELISTSEVRRPERVSAAKVKGKFLLEWGGKPTAIQTYTLYLFHSQHKRA